MARRHGKRDFVSLDPSNAQMLDPLARLSSINRIADIARRCPDDAGAKFAQLACSVSTTVTEVSLLRCNAKITYQNQHMTTEL